MYLEVYSRIKTRFACATTASQKQLMGNASVAQGCSRQTRENVGGRRGQPAGNHLGPVVLISIIKLESDETHRDQLDGAPPELAAHLCISSKRPALTLTMSCNDCGVVDYLTYTHRAVPSVDETLTAIRDVSL